MAKTINYLFLVLSLLLLTSCRRQEDIFVINTGSSNGSTDLSDYYNKTAYWINATLSFAPLGSNGTVDLSDYYNKNETNNTIDAKLATTTYYPTSIQTIYGTYVQGNTTAISYMFDNQVYEVQEGTGVNSLEVRVNFTGVDSFNQGVTRVWYDGGSAHYIDICLYNYLTSSWDCAWDIEIAMNYTIVSGTVFNDNNYIDNGKVQVKLQHVGSGNINHYLYIDSFIISKGVSSITSNEHDALSGRNNICTNHPEVCTKYYNITQTTSRYYNITQSDTNFVKRNDWTTIDNYPTACTAGKYVSGIGDTLSCVDIPDTSNTNEIQTLGTSGSSITLTSGGTARPPSDTDWTYHDSYPVACGAGQYVSAIGDTLTCSTPAGGSSTAQLIYFDEFQYYATARTNGIGVCAALSSGTAAAVTDDYIGVIRFSDSTTANGGFQCRSDATSMYFRGGEKLTFRFKLANRATNIHQFGFSDSTTAAAQVDGCTINGANLVMTAVCRNNNAQTANETTYTLTALTWYIGEIEALSTTQVRFRIYNADKSTLLWSVTVSSNVPNTSARAFGTRISSWETSTDAAAILAYFDYVKLEDTSYT